MGFFSDMLGGMKKNPLLIAAPMLAGVVGRNERHAQEEQRTQEAINKNPVEYLNSPEYQQYKAKYLKSMEGEGPDRDIAANYGEQQVAAMKYGGQRQFSKAQEMEARRKFGIDRERLSGEEKIARSKGQLDALMKEASLRMGGQLGQAQMTVASQKPRESVLGSLLGGII